MTKEEAIEILKSNKPTSDPRKCGKELCTAVDKAIEALKKQIPKKVEWTEDYTWGKKTDQPVCPVCDYYLTMHHFIGGSKKISYCDTCGQAIAWEE